MTKVILETGLTGLVRTRPVMIITTVHENGVVNAGTFGAYSNLGPREIGVAISRMSDTYQNIKRTGEYVINIPSIDNAEALEICGKAVSHDQSEVELAGLTLENSKKINVPLIVECVSNVEMEYWKEVEIGHHVFVIGKAVCGHLDQRFVDEDGKLDVIKAKVVHGIRYPEPIYARLGETVTI